MSPGEVFVLIVRWIHGIAAVAWIGGSLFFLIVLIPSIERKIGLPDGLKTEINNRFRGLVQTCILVLIITGVILAFDRLSSRFTDIAYVSVLAIKSLITIWMFILSGFIQPRKKAPLDQRKSNSAFTLSKRWDKLFGKVNEPNLILLLGLVAFMLSDGLQTLFERALMGP